jgi:hypothetical protein
MAQHSLVGQGISHYWDFAMTNTPHSVGLLWMSDQPDAENSTWQHNILKREKAMHPAGFEPAIPANERPQTHTLDRAATWIDF